MTFLSRSSAISSLPSKETQLYLVDLKNIKNAEVSQAKTLLDRETFERANRCIFLKDRQRKIVVYAALRFYLEGLIGQKASDIKLLRTSCGKPYVKERPVHFNISHTRQYAMLSFHPYFPIGVDIEQVRKTSNVLELADLFMHPDEKIQMLDSGDVIDYFFSLWSCKEAFLKAKGISFDQLPKWNLEMDFSYNNYQSVSSKHDIYLYGETIKSHKIAVCIDREKALI